LEMCSHIYRRACRRVIMRKKYCEKKTKWWILYTVMLYKTFFLKIYINTEEKVSTRVTYGRQSCVSGTFGWWKMHKYTCTPIHI
jgi:hypothetical protein